eukprot:TRINITY_DN5239_c0_g1_i1.p1 TRINITY_DN5239_c0_g1~~TRINITY_DN5239_c0_g1_i1.p1  ORF type:complete len:573 (-),score=11.02 TRINITY_DN5239_c0_g1_i1:982-2700(-)
MWLFIQLLLHLVLQQSLADDDRVPGCGDLQHMRWNSTCYMSQVKFIDSQPQRVALIHNLLMFDGKLYYITPHEVQESMREKIQTNISSFASQELDLEVVNVGKSPFIFGKPSMPSPYEIKKIRTFNSTLIILSQNLQERINEQVDNTEQQYVRSGDVQSILCNVLHQCEVNENTRDTTLIMNTVLTQSRMDWENSVTVDCFTNQGFFPVSLSARFNTTLFLLRRVVMYQPRVEGYPKQENVPTLDPKIHDQCISSGYGYDPSAKIQEKKPYDVSVCVLFKNEAKYLLEWIAYHNSIGVDHFYMYNDYSTDGFMEILQPLIDKSIVTLHNRSEIRSVYEYGHQQTLLTHCGYTYRNMSKWFLLIDIDEFLVVRGEEYKMNIHTWINSHPILSTNTGAVELPREAMGGNYYPINYTQLVISEIFHKAFPSPKNHDLKALVNSNGLGRLEIHWAQTYKPLRKANLDDKCFIRSTHDSNCTELNTIAVFHYIAKSFDLCMYRANATIWENPWRSQAGEAFCKDVVFGYKNQPERWYEDRFLANDYVTRMVCNRMKELNEKWYARKNACGDYLLQNK